MKKQSLFGMILMSLVIGQSVWAMAKKQTAPQSDVPAAPAQPQTPDGKMPSLKFSLQGGIGDAEFVATRDLVLKVQKTLEASKIQYSDSNVSRSVVITTQASHGKNAYLVDDELFATPQANEAEILPLLFQLMRPEEIVSKMSFEISSDSNGMTPESYRAIQSRVLEAYERLHRATGDCLRVDGLEVAIYSAPIAEENLRFVLDPRYTRVLIYDTGVSVTSTADELERAFSRAWNDITIHCSN